MMFTINKFENERQQNEENIDCLPDNIYVKDDIEIPDLKYSVEGVRIKAESVSCDVQLRDYDFEIDESRPKTETLHFVPNMESGYVQKEEISIKDVLDNDDNSNEFETHSDSYADTRLLWNDNQVTKQQKVDKIYSKRQVPPETSQNGTFSLSFSTNSSPKISSEGVNRLGVSKTSKDRLCASRNGSYQLHKVNDGFICSQCTFQSQLEVKVDEHFENYQYSKNSNLLVDGIVHDKNSNNSEGRFGIELFKCSYCDYKTDNKSYFKSHIIVHSDDIYNCKHCDYKTHNKKNLKRHMIIHSCEFPRYKCEYCDYKTQFKQYFRQHLKVHSVECKFLKCDHCDYKTKYRTNLNKHLKRHSNECYLYKCEHCEYKTKFKNCIEEHLKTHSVDCEFYKCDRCDYKTKFKSNLNRHLRQHSNECVLYKCEQCDYKTKYMHHLKQHFIASDDCNLYKCEYCDYKTHNTNNLKHHVLLHSRELSPFKCEDCDFKTIYKQNLKIHRKVHSDECHFYKCEHCNYKSLYKRNLKRHALLHFKECNLQIGAG